LHLPRGCHLPVGEKQTFRFGPFELDTECGQLRKNGIGLKLQGQPVQILEILLEKPGQLVTRDELRQRLWASDTFVDFDHSLNTAVKKLREALGDDAEKPIYIETLPKRGYRFIGEVASGDSLAKHSGAELPPGEDVVSRITATLVGTVLRTASESRRRVRRSIWLAMLAALVLIAAATATWWLTKPPPLPRIVGSHSLTKTGHLKWVWARPIADDKSIYFKEGEASSGVISRVSVLGGETTNIRPLERAGLSVWWFDISRDGSQLLFQVDEGNEAGAWIKTLPDGVPRLVLKNAVLPLWTADGRGIFFVDSSDRDLYRANVDGTNVQKVVSFPDYRTPYLSPDGLHIRFGVWPGPTMWEVATDGSHPHVLLDGRKNVRGGSLES